MQKKWATNSGHMHTAQGPMTITAQHTTHASTCTLTHKQKHIGTCEKPPGQKACVIITCLVYLDLFSI